MSHNMYPYNTNRANSSQQNRKEAGEDYINNPNPWDESEEDQGNYFADKKQAGANAGQQDLASCGCSGADNISAQAAAAGNENPFVDGKNSAPATEDIGENSAAQTDPQAAINEDIEKATRELADLRLRMAAEMDNFKKRLTREHQEQIRYASEKIISDLLPALDNLDLAIHYGSGHEACKDMMLGVEMTRKQLQDVLSKNGLITVGEKGEAFDPAIHEAIGVESTQEVAKDAVSRVLQKGYKLNERLLRPAKVMVNK